jgi:hypothetical protein
MLGVTRTMEISMHGSFDRSGETDNSTYRSWGFGFLALPALLAIMLVGLAIVQPSASNWISEAAQAELAAAILAPDVAPTQLAKPAMEIRTVRAE